MNWIRKSIILSVILGILFSPISCKKDPPENNDNPEPTTPEIEISPLTKVVPELARMSIMHIDTGFTFMVVNGNEYFDALKKGDIMADGVWEKAPYGYLRKITNITEENGIKTIQTRQASLAEAIKTGSIRMKTEDVKLGEIQSIRLAKGVHLKNTKNPEFTVFDFEIDHTFTASGSEINLQGNSKLSMNLFFDFDWSVEFDLDWIPISISVDYFETGIKVEQSSAIAVNSESGISLNQDVELAYFTLTPITFFVGPVPVVFFPVVSLDVNMNGEITANFSVSASENLTAKLGVKYDDSWGKINTIISSNTDFSAPAIQSSIAVSTSVGPKASILLYGIAGPYAMAGGCLGLEAQPNGGNWNLDMNVGVNYNVGIEVDILGFEEDWSLSDEPLCLFQTTVLHLDDEPFDDAIYITEPANGSHVTLGSEKTIKTFYTGATPESVRFLIDGNEVAIDTDEPFEYVWNTLDYSQGTHTIKVLDIVGGEEVSSDEATIQLTIAQWEAMSLAPLVGGNDAMFNDVYFINDEEGWIVGTNNSQFSNTILHTNNGGANWSVVYDMNNAAPLLKVEFLGSTTGLGIEFMTRELMQLNSGGSEIGIFSYNGVAVFNNYFVWDFANSILPTGLNVITSDENGFYVMRTSTEPGEIVQTTAYDGNNGNILFTGNKGIVYNIVNVNATHDYLISNDGGESWEQKTMSIVPFGQDLTAGQVYDNNTIWLVGTKFNFDQNPPVADGGFVVISTDGGNTWTRQDVPIAKGFESLTMLSTTEAYASSAWDSDIDEPKVFHTEDGGFTWEAVDEISSEKGIMKVLFKGQDFGIAVGLSGTIFRYTNQK
jgi:photosystem II stability/assembly factor-like uncharacterized protein